jgi:hypothetical protein
MAVTTRSTTAEKAVSEGMVIMGVEPHAAGDLVVLVLRGSMEVTVGIMVAA